MRLFYITDRAPEQDEQGNLLYGYGRSSSVAFGTVIVDLGEDLTWEDLLLASRLQKRLKPVELKVRQVTEVLRGPDTPVPFAMVDGKIVEQPEESAEREAATQAFRQILIDQLAMTPRKEVFLYVHGYHNNLKMPPLLWVNCGTFWGASACRSSIPGRRGIRGCSGILTIASPASSLFTICEGRLIFSGRLAGGGKNKRDRPQPGNRRGR